MDEYDVGVIVKDIGGMDLKTYDGRISLQRVVYLLQAFGLGLGYRYMWMLSGPISLKLMEDAFHILVAVERLPLIPIKFEDGDDDRRYGDLKGFLAGKVGDLDALDMAVSICYLRNEVGVGKDEVLRLTCGKKSRYAEAACQDMWDELETCGAVAA